MKITRYILLFAALLCFATASASNIVVGAARTDVYLPHLEGKRIALLSNHTGIVDGVHTLDILLANGLDVTTIFSPEHGFRGTADAGQHVAGNVDPETGIPIVSLYNGSRSRTPAPEIMDRFDVIVCDLQDVGVRFYTYYCTMTDLMVAAAAHGKEFVIFDRPNPNGMRVDGPILDMSLESGVGRLPIPVLHGLTLGEMARMAVGEGWLKGCESLQLHVIECEGYTHSARYELPVPPSPNLPDMKAIYLYPSTCFFEATDMSVGRGTDMPFRIYGHPRMQRGDFYFTPQSRIGARRPPQMGVRCRGRNLSNLSDDEIIQAGLDLSYIIDAYRGMGKPQKFLSSFFEKLIGNRQIRSMIEQGMSADEIRQSWANDVKQFRHLRSKYLIYPE